MSNLRISLDLVKRFVLDQYWVGLFLVDIKNVEKPDIKTINFDVLQTRLLLHVNWRINNGEYTERGLARVLGISQPQMHNVRKGARRLSVALADRILVKFRMSALDLIEEWEVLECMDLRNPGWRETKRKPLQVERSRVRWREDVG